MQIQQRLVACAYATAALARAVEPTTGNLNVLSMNVAGLPAILQSNDVPGDKVNNAETMGRLFAQSGFDIIHVQEDFNYHANIYSTDTHPYRTATSGGAGFGSGLNTLAAYPWLDFERVKWATCSDASENDCLTPKGFTFMRVAVATSGTSTVAYVDCYNLHTDAGTEADDVAARNANLAQVGEYRAKWSKGNAVLVFGDTNSRYSRAGDTGIRGLLDPSGAGLTDVWVELERAGVVPTAESLCDNPSVADSCETVDKVLYRSSPLLQLRAVDFHHAGDFFHQPDGNILSDHNPVAANFTWTPGTSLQQSPLWGGPHGTWFNDAPALALRTTTTTGNPHPKPTSLTLRGGSRLDAVSLTLTDGRVLSHGGGGGSSSTLALSAGEFWTAATVCRGEHGGRTRVFFLGAGTSVGRSLAAGTRTGDCAGVAAPRGWQIVGFLGRRGRRWIAWRLCMRRSEGRLR